MAYLPRQGGGCWSPDDGGWSLFEAAEDFLSRHKSWLVGAAAVVGAVKIYGVYKRRQLRAEWNDAGPNVVVFHTLPPGLVCPSPVPAAIKLETFFRLAKIEYKKEYNEPVGPKHKIPWITINGEDIADSEIIIERLQKMFSKFQDPEMSEEERAVGVAMRIMMEEHFYWGFVSWRYSEDKLRGFAKVYKMPFWIKLAFTAFQLSVAKTLYAQGTGRHSFDEIHHFMRKDLEAVSRYLGTKSFLHGDALSVVDCAIFGSLCQIVYNCPGSPYEKYIKEDFPNLLAYVERVRARLWPDWQSCLANA